VIVDVDPLNEFEYVDGTGRKRVFRMPPGVRIVSSTTPIVFRPDGSVLVAASTEIRAQSGAGEERVIRVDVPRTGIPEVVAVSGD
jgi:hypothetical protein